MHRAGIAYWPIVIILGAGILGWNASHFVGAVQQPRTKNLDFLPPPVVAQALACGQGTALAKLRWIDSFAYTQLQFDRQDDRVAGEGERGGFERLYDTLITLDPAFVPFYEHGVVNTSGVLKHHQAALSIIMRGLDARPNDTGLWRLASAMLAVQFDWAKRNPANLDRWLNAWAAAESEDGRQAVLDWRRGLAFTHVEGLETLPYWIEQLRGTRPGTAMADFVEGTVRELLAQHGCAVLKRIAGGSQGWLPSGSLLPWAPPQLDVRAAAAEWPRSVPAWAPVMRDASGWQLRADPFGWPWIRRGAEVVSPGADQRRFLKQTFGQRSQIQGEADQRGRAPADLAEARAWGVELPVPPHGGHWDFSQHLPDVAWPDPPSQPWQLR